MENKETTSYLEETSPLPLEDLACPICLEIFIEPITLVCKHELCNECYKSHFEKAEFKCPLCKKRLNSWARNMKGSLINEAKWKMIKKWYPDEVEKRRKGESISLFKPPKVVLADGGQVNEEYLKMKEEYELAKEKERQEEEEASKALIEKLLEEEKEEEKRKTMEKDAEIARLLSLKMNKKVSPSNLHKISLRSRKRKVETYQNKRKTKATKEPSVYPSIKQYLSPSFKDPFSINKDAKTPTRKTRRTSKSIQQFFKTDSSRPSTSQFDASPQSFSVETVDLTLDCGSEDTLIENHPSKCLSLNDEVEISTTNVEISTTNVEKVETSESLNSNPEKLETVMNLNSNPEKLETIMSLNSNPEKLESITSLNLNPEKLETITSLNSNPEKVETITNLNSNAEKVETLLSMSDCLQCDKSIADDNVLSSVKLPEHDIIGKKLSEKEAELLIRLFPQNSDTTI